MTAPFTDPGTGDTHTCSINWGDGVVAAGAVVEAAGSGTCTGSHSQVAATRRAVRQHVGVVRRGPAVVHGLATTSGLGTCTRDTLGLNPLYTGVGGLFNASWLTAGLQAADGTTSYYETFKAKCPFAYTWQYDDSASGYGCNAIAVPNGGQAFSGFDMTFCGSAQLAGPGVHRPAPWSHSRATERRSVSASAAGW